MELSAVLSLQKLGKTLNKYLITASANVGGVLRAIGDRLYMFSTEMVEFINLL
jgi:hypothetical protein